MTPMRVAQMILPGASAYERKSQRIDAAALVEAGHEVVGVDECEIAHLYAPAEFSASVARELRVAKRRIRPAQAELSARIR